MSLPSALRQKHFDALDALIADPRKAELFNEAKAEQLRAWAAIRNHAAHGEFGQFSKADVESMVNGIKGLLEELQETSHAKIRPQ